MPQALPIARSIRPRLAVDVFSILESLERRAMLSSASINYSDFSSIGGLTTNGFAGDAPTSGGQLVLTDSQLNEARSVFYTTPVPFDHFTTHFTYQVNAGSNPADGLTFTLQENGPTAVGAVGGSLGYQGMGGANSVAVALDIYGSSKYFVYDNGAPVTPPNNFLPFSNLPFNLTNGDPYDITVSYDGAMLTTTVTDQTNSASTFTASTSIDLSSELGATTAYAGFTAATGSAFSTQRVSAWNYAGNDGLTITTPAAASNITAKSATLSVAATDTTSGGAIDYAWSIVHKPSGAADPTFDDNNSTTSDNTGVHFSRE